MNTNIYIDDDLFARLIEYTKLHKISRSLLIREAVSDWLDRHSKNSWRKDFFEFEGIDNFPVTEELRKGLANPKGDPFS